MPSTSSFHRTLAKKKRSGPTHREVMEKRHAKRRKSEKKNLMTKKMKALEEYQRLSKIEYESKKTTAMNIMELVEEIKERIPDGTYLKMMDELMALNSESERRGEETHNIRRNLYETDYYYDIVGDNRNLNNEREDIINTLNENIIRVDNIINDIDRNISTNRNIVDNTVRDGWRRIGQGTWMRVENYTNIEQEDNSGTQLVDDY